MRGKRTWSLVLGSAAVLAAICAVAVSLTSDGPAVPAFNRGQAKAMLPVIEAFLDSPAGGNQGGYLTSTYPKLKPRVFCTAAIIEIRPDGRQWRVGMETGCGEFARRGDTLLVGTEGGTEEVMVLGRQGGSYQVRSAAASNSVGPDPGWVDQHFSPAAAAEISDARSQNPPDPAQQARRAFGFPPGTPAVSP